MSHEISLDNAAAMTADYRTNVESILDSSYQNQGILAFCETFAKAEVISLLEDDGCHGLRIYYGMDTNMKVHAILVGVNSQDEDILPTVTEDPTDKILEQGTRCPVDCPPASALNQ